MKIKMLMLRNRKKKGEYENDVERIELKEVRNCRGRGKVKGRTRERERGLGES